MKYLLLLISFLLFFYSCDDVESVDNILNSHNNIVLFSQTGENCSSAIDEISSSTTIQSTTQGFANSFLAPTSCSDTPSPDKVYKIVLNSTKKVTAEIFNSDLDTVLYLKRGCETEAIVCNDDKNNNDYQSKISLVLEAGEYFLVVDGYGNSSAGAFELKVDIETATGESCSNTQCRDDYKCEIQNNTPTCICNSGNCDVQDELNEKDITINEFMVNPSGTDRYNEWIEIKNNTNNDIEIKNLKILKDSSAYFANTKNLKIKANSYFLIVSSPNVKLNTYDLVISNMSLNNTGTHLLKLLVNDVLVDEVTYSGSSSGKSLQYDGSTWCDSRSDISESNTDKGTPYLDNIQCGDVCSHNCNNHGVCDAIDGHCECNVGYKGELCNECQSGYELSGSICKEVLSQLLNERDIIITEFMPNPLGSDTTGEYIELYNRTDQDLSLNGLKIIRDDDTAWNLDDGYTIRAHSYFVIGRSSTAADGRVDAILSSISLSNTLEHSLTIQLSDLALDVVTYVGSIEGQAKQLDKNKYDDDYEEVNWCDKNETPQSENLACNVIDLCKNVNCNNGECFSDESGYLCICQVGYTGDNCELCEESNPDCARSPQVGDLVISELMIDPSGSDTVGEWIEIYNKTNNKIKLENVKIKKDTIIYNVTLVNTTINQNSYYLIARSQSIENADAYSTMSLNNTGVHNISILVNGIEIDNINYESSKTAISFQLDGSMLNAQSNDNLNYWCDGTAEIENWSDKGTPKAQNRGCGSCATLECPLNSVCVSSGDNAQCVCQAGYQMDNEVGICVMTEQCGVLYDSVRNLTGDELKLALQQLTGQRYNPIEYDVSRKIMYREIDKDENNEVQCVYTGRKMKVIEGEELDSRSGDCNIRTCNCGNPGMNTEHTWPQGQFDKLEPMKGDVHHLFPADACTNGRRSSFKFGNVVAPEGTFGSISYKDEYGNEYGMSKLGRTNGQTVFEPPLIHKGDVARAIFYFIIRYGNYSNYLDDTQEATLRQWAIDDPVSSKERIRNNKIEKLQWNRNPFVDCPQLIDVIPDF